MKIKEFNYEKKDGTVKSYSALILDETEKDMYALVLDTVSESDRQLVEDALADISSVIDRNKKTSFRKFFKESVVSSTEKG